MVVTTHPVDPEGFGSDPLEQVALQLLCDLSASIALDEAMVIADERLQGATLLQRVDTAAMRATETRGLMESLSERDLLAIANHLDTAGPAYARCNPGRRAQTSRA